MAAQKIAVVGCCTATIIANCLRVLRPTDHVAAFLVDQLADGPPVEQDFDLVFAVANAGDFRLAERLAACRSLVWWPNPVFFGFQPDITYFGIDGRPVRSAMGDYNSFVAASGYAEGLSVRSTVRLFNKLVYARVGFFEKYELSRAALIAAADRIDFDLREPLARWERAGVFMYSINHPKLCVLADIARELLRKAGLPFDEALSLADHVPDHLAQGGIWPVYPEIARHIGVAGSRLFMPACHQQFDVKSLTLEKFVARTFDIYAKDGFSAQDIAGVAGIQVTLEKLAA